MSTIAATLIVIVSSCAGHACAPESKYPMTSMETCIESVKSAKVEVARGGDAEGSAVIFCVQGDKSDK